MDGPSGIIVSEISHSEKRQISYNFTYMYNVRKHKHTKEKQIRRYIMDTFIDTENRLMVDRGGEVRGWEKMKG